MSINLENPETVLGMVDAAANYVAQIRIALMVDNKHRAMDAVGQAERLLFNATLKLQETERAWELGRMEGLKWARDHIIPDGNPEVAIEKVDSEIDRMINPPSVEH